MLSSSRPFLLGEFRYSNISKLIFLFVDIMNNSYKKSICDSCPCFGSIKLANFITAYFHKVVDNYIYFHVEYDGTSRISYHRAKIRYDDVGFPYIMLGTRIIHIPNNEEVLNENNQM